MEPHESKPAGQERGGHGHHEKSHTFSFTYDDTGATVRVTAPSTRTMQHVIEEAYRELKEAPRPDDRVEFGTHVMTPELRALTVDEFVARRLDPDGKFHIVSKPGGAAGSVECTDRSRRI